MVFPRRLIHAALVEFPSFDDRLEVELKRHEYYAGSKIEFFRTAAASPGDDIWAVAELSLAPKRVRKLVKRMHKARPAGVASVEYRQKGAGKPSFAQNAIMAASSRATILFHRMQVIPRSVCVGGNPCSRGWPRARFRDPARWQTYPRSVFIPTPQGEAAQQA